jgi:hypothetical protein
MKYLILRTKQKKIKKYIQIRLRYIFIYNHYIICTIMFYTHKLTWNWTSNINYQF